MAIEVANIALLPKDFVIFFCWQDHLDRKMYRFLIRDALKGAITRIQRELPSTANCRVRFDSDTMDRAGTVEIANTICEKIRQSTVVLADVTPVLVEEKNDWFYPNPNVMTEVGYAGAMIGWNRLICLFNDRVCKAEQLPFDIRHRRATAFSCADPAKAKEATTELEGTLYVAIRAVVQEIGRGALDPALTDSALKRARDVRLLRDVMGCIDTNFIDHYLKKGLETVFVYDILYYWHGFEAIIDSSQFRFYDRELEACVQKLFKHWGAALDIASTAYSPNGIGGYTLKGDQYWSQKDHEQFERLMAELNDARTALKVLLSYVHEQYQEIDIKETNKAAHESIKKYLD